MSSLDVEFEEFKKDWFNVCFEVYDDNFIKALTQKNRNDITRFMAYLVSIPEKYRVEFCKFIFNLTDLPSTVACILFASFYNLKKFDINKKYKVLIDEIKYSPKSFNMLKTICDIYGIKIKEQKSVFGKLKIKLEFSDNLKEQVINEAEKLPKKVKKENASLSKDYDDFVNWWSTCDESAISKDETLFGAYQIMWLYNEVCNGGFDQFWDFAENSEWNLEDTKKSFKKLLPKEFFDLYSEALTAHKANKNCEKFNKLFDDKKMEKQVLPKLASKVMKILNTIK